MSEFYRRAEEILEIATAGDGGLGDTALVLDRQGGFLMMDPAGWSVAALAAEYGADAVYKVQRRGGLVRVEGWNRSHRCLLQSEASGEKLQNLLNRSIFGFPVHKAAPPAALPSPV